MKLNKVPRKLKKRIKNSVLILDLSKIPNGWDIEQWMHFYTNFGIAVYKDGEKAFWIKKDANRFRRKFKK